MFTERLLRLVARGNGLKPGNTQYLHGNSLIGLSEIFRSDLFANCVDKDAQKWDEHRSKFEQIAHFQSLVSVHDSLVLKTP